MTTHQLGTTNILRDLLTQGENINIKIEPEDNIENNSNPEVKLEVEYDNVTTVTSHDVVPSQNIKIEAEVNEEDASTEIKLEVEYENDDAVSNSSIVSDNKDKMLSISNLKNECDDNISIEEMILKSEEENTEDSHDTSEQRSPSSISTSSRHSTRQSKLRNTPSKRPTTKSVSKEESRLRLKRERFAEEIEVARLQLISKQLDIERERVKVEAQRVLLESQRVRVDYLEAIRLLRTQISQLAERGSLLNS